MRGKKGRHGSKTQAVSGWYDGGCTGSCKSWKDDARAPKGWKRKRLCRWFLQGNYFLVQNPYTPLPRLKLRNPYWHRICQAYQMFPILADIRFFTFHFYSLSSFSFFFQSPIYHISHSPNMAYSWLICIFFLGGGGVSGTISPAGGLWPHLDLRADWLGERAEAGADGRAEGEPAGADCWPTVGQVGQLLPIHKISTVDMVESTNSQVPVTFPEKIICVRHRLNNSGPTSMSHMGKIRKKGEIWKKRRKSKMYA